MNVSLRIATLLIVFIVFSTRFVGAANAASEIANPSLNTAPTSWLTEYEQALKIARDEHRLILVNFTGSDWCIWCHRIDSEILSQKPFYEYAQKTLVLLEIDFPQNKVQSAALKKQNAALAEKFSVQGYPTILLLDAEGRELGRTGYMEGGAKTFVRELKRLAVVDKS